MTMANRELVIRIYFPKWGWRGWLSALGVLMALGTAAAIADVMWTPFVQGEKLSSAKLNTDLTNIVNAVNALQNAPPGSTPQAHILTNKDNTDLGIYLGAGSAGQFLALSPTVKAPFWFYYSQ